MERTLDYRPSKAKRERTPLSPKALRLFRIASFTLLLLLLAVALTDLWARRIDPDGGWGTLPFDFLFFLGAVVIPGILLLFWLFRMWRYIKATRRTTECMIFVAATLAIVVGTVTLNAAAVPFQLAFAFSRPALERAATALSADPTLAMHGKTIGWFPIEGVRVDGPQVSFLVDGAGFDVNHALIHRAGSPPLGTMIEPLGRDWYLSRHF